MTSGGDDHAELINWLVAYLILNIGCSPEDIDLDVPFNEMGVGSRDAVVLSGELSERLGRAVSPVDFWQNPTINSLAIALLNPDADAPDGDGAGAAAATHNEPIAVIGLGCRLPGDIHGPDALWNFLADGRSAVGTVPAERWESFDDGSPETRAALARTTRWGSFLSGVEDFDAEFFDISPSEADRIDPQQRLLLEVAIEALDHAGIAPDSLQRTQTGVFAGACLGEYGYLASRELNRVDAWSGTGGALSIIANRLSYFLDLRGPSVTVDTACSSSLVAIHLATKSLRTAESDLAIAAGVNLVLSPAVTHSFDRAEAMSRSGACRAFDAGADGFVRGEGCGVVILKRLSDALRDGDRILAVVRGTAVNQDGRSNGLMAPNPAAQTAVLRAACEDAGVAPAEVDYVETHGTGTLLGDPIEARALGSVYGRAHQPEAPLLIGAVKTNLGHLEAAAGVTGFIKAVLAVQHAEIPANLHFDAPNPHIPFEELRLKVVDRPTGWPASERPRRAGVSSFGFGGTNAHAVIEEPPAPQPADRTAAAPAVTTLVVSGKTPGRVASWAGVLADWMDGAGQAVALSDIAHTLNHHRSHQNSFGTVAARERHQAVAGLRALAAGQAAVGVAAPHPQPCTPGTVFVYSGQGSQWAGMGRRLLADEPAFADAVAALEPDFVEQTGFSLQKVLEDGEPVTGIDRIQPVLVGVQLALTALWRSYGVHPDAVIGHSMGEVTAAVVAGALAPAEGLRVIATRSRLMARLAGQGAMALVELAPQAAHDLVDADPDLTVAVYASPRQSVIAGPPEKIEAMIAELSGRDLLARAVEVDVASHHPTVDPILAELRAALGDLMPMTPTIPIITTTAGRDGDAGFDADYWVDNLRNPVRFTQAVRAAAEQHGTFIEVSPHPLLTYAIADTVAPAHHHALGTLQRDADEVLVFHANRNAAHTVHPPGTPHPPEPHPQLPSAPWQHCRHWFPTVARPVGAVAAPTPGMLLGEKITVSSGTLTGLWQSRLTPEVKPYPGPHRLHGVEVVPASVLCQTVLTAAGTGTVRDVRFIAPVLVDQPRFVQVVAQAVADGDTVTMSSSLRPDAAADRWVRHVQARAGSGPVAPVTPIDPARAEPGPIDDAAVAAFLGDRGIDGPPFQWSVESLTATPDGVLAEVRLPDPTMVALLDSVLHLAPMAAADDTRLLVPAAAREIQVADAVTGSAAWVTVRPSGQSDDGIVVDLTAVASDGTVLITIRGLHYAAVDARPAGADTRRFAHRIHWRPRPAGESGAPPVAATVAVVGPDPDANERLRQAIGDTGHRAGSPDDARYVIYLAGDETDHGDLDASVRASAEVSELVRRLCARADAHPVTLWLITRGVLESAEPAALRQSALWGLAGVIAAEQPDIAGGLIDVDAAAEPQEWLPVMAEHLSAPSRRILVLRDGQVLAPELVAVDGEPVRPALQCRPDAAYLITGGLGALGLAMAGWLADRGARRLVLAGRTGLPPRSAWDSVTDPLAFDRIEAIRSLESRGVAVEAVSVDVADRQAVAAMIERRDRDGAPPIRGVIHAAGVTGDQLVTDIDDDTLRAVMSPKIAGAHVLHDAFPVTEVDFMFFAASAATVFGVTGQGGYAAANAYLDALARLRHGHGAAGQTLSIDWVAWRGLGFGADAPIVVAELQRLGSRPIEAAEAFEVWDYLSRHDLAQAVVMPVASEPEPGPGPTGAPAAGRDFSAMPAAQVQSLITDGLRAILARELRLAESEVGLDVPFAELGLNSMMAMSIRREAELLVGMELSATMLWNHPTVSALAGYLTAKVAPQQVEPGAVSGPLEPDTGGGLLDELFSSVESGGLGSEDVR